MSGDTLRGESWKTKTSERGRPFGVAGLGLLGGGSWCSIFRRLLTEWLSLVPVKSQASIDFLLPSMDKLGSVRNQPCSYVEACMGLRRLLAEIEGVFPEAYTLHSCKTTVLAWAMQLRLPEGDRAKQCHHRGSAGNRCVALYSREDVEPMLWLQKQVQSSILDGWRPHSVQLRGTLPPLEEPKVVLEAPTDSDWDGESLDLINQVSGGTQVGVLSNDVYPSLFGLFFFCRQSKYLAQKIWNALSTLWRRVLRCDKSGVRVNLC